MTPEVFLRVVVAPALTLLPAPLDTSAARALLVAIALQESGLTARRQAGNGPARSYLQFERVGLRGLLQHPRSHGYLKRVCTALDVVPNVYGIYRAIEFQDGLAVCCGRLLLWTLPAPLPVRGDDVNAWEQYLACWRPGKPRPDAWAGNVAAAWDVVAPEV